MVEPLLPSCFSQKLSSALFIASEGFVALLSIFSLLLFLSNIICKFIKWCGFHTSISPFTSCVGISGFGFGNGWQSSDRQKTTSDGGLTICPDPDQPFPDPKPKPLIPKEEPKGEIDVWNPYHLMNLQMMFERNKKIADVEKNATKPSDAINSALDNFWEKQDGSNDPSKQKELL